MSRNTGNIIKFTLDFIMALTVVLLYESHVINLAFHEIAGICIFGVFLIHCLFNWKWVTGVGAKLFSRSIPARTRFSYWMTILCILLFACIIISGVFISKVLFGQMLSDNRTLGTVFRVMHIFCSALSLIVLGIHVGLYWDFVKRLVGKAIKLPRQAARPVAMVLLAAVCVTGVWSIYSTDFRTWILSPVFGTGQGSHGHGEESEAGETGETGEAGETDATGEAGEENAENASAADGAASSEDSGRSEDSGSSGRSATAEAAESSEGSGRDGRSDSETAESGERGESSETAEGSADSESAESGEGGSRSGGGHGHGSTTIDPLTILRNIANYGSIIGLFAVITYYLDRLIKRRRKSTAANSDKPDSDSDKASKPAEKVVAGDLAVSEAPTADSGLADGSHTTAKPAQAKPSGKGTLVAIVLIILAIIATIIWGTLKELSNLNASEETTETSQESSQDTRE